MLKAQVEQRISLVTAVLALFVLVANNRAFAQEALSSSETAQIASGVQALKLGDLDSAERIFNEALLHGVKRPLVFHNLGVIAQQKGNHQLAITRFRQALLLQPNYGPSRLLLGSNLLAVGKISESTHELNRAVVLMPKEPAAHLELAKAYEAQDNWLQAVDQLQQLTRLAPASEEYSYQLGKAFTKLSSWSLEEISRANPDAARLHQALGQEYLIQERYDQALEAYKQAVRSDPNLPELHLGMALILMQLKRFADARKEIELELKLIPDSKAAAEAKAKIEAAKVESSP
jgi:Tfp pilus assembly protein PilF